MPHVHSGLGIVCSSTVLRSAPNCFAERAPYGVAPVRLAKGTLGAAQLTDIGSDGMVMGMEVRMVTRRPRTVGRFGLVPYAGRFRPVLAVAAVDGTAMFSTP